MKLSRILIYIIILGALASWVYFFEIGYKDAKRAEEEKTSLIVKTAKDQVVQIELKSSDGRHIVIVKPEETWVLTSPIKTKADQGAVNALLTSVAQAKPEKIVQEKDVNWHDYGLDRPQFSIVLKTKESANEIFFGESNPSRSSYYVRLNDESKLLLVADTLKNSLSKSLFDLRDKSVSSIVPADVERIVVSLKGQETELSREGADKWVMRRPDQMRVKGSLIEKDLNSLANLRAKQIIDEPKKDGDPCGLEDPTIEITLSGPKRTETLFMGPSGRKEAGAESDLCVRVKGDDTVYLVDGRSIKGLSYPDPTLLRDRSVFSFSPADVEKIAIDLDQKKWVAVKGSNNQWSLEQPQKVAHIDTWSITSILWELKDLEWKSMRKGGPDSAAISATPPPQLLVSIFLQGSQDPISLSATWDRHAAAALTRTESQDKPTTDLPDSLLPNTPPKASNDNDKTQTTKPHVPELVTALVKPHWENEATFEIKGTFVDRLRRELARIDEKNQRE